MNLQVCGIGILIVSAVYYSYVLIHHAGIRLSQLEDTGALILFIRNHIESFMTPITEILRSFKGYSVYFEEFVCAAQELGMCEAMECGKLEIGPDAEKVLFEFSKKIGSGFKEDELRLCNYCHSAITEILKKEREDLNRKMKMYKTLPIMTAMSAVLILL